MKTKEYETISAVVASRRKAGDDYGHIRADLEAARNKPFQDDEWGKIRFLAALDVAFASVPKPSKGSVPSCAERFVAPSCAEQTEHTHDQPAPSQASVIHIHADTDGHWSVTEEKPE